RSAADVDHAGIAEVVCARAGGGVAEGDSDGAEYSAGVEVGAGADVADGDVDGFTGVCLYDGGAGLIEGPDAGVADVEAAVVDRQPAEAAKRVIAVRSGRGPDGNMKRSGRRAALGEGTGSGG